MNFEIHITVSGAQAREARLVAEIVGWKFSAIDGDPLLGPGVNCYLTHHAKDFMKALEQLRSVCLDLNNHHVQVLRQKIELVVFDTKRKGLTP